MMKYIEIEYRFEVEGKRKNVHKVLLDPISLQSVLVANDGFPHWTTLSFQQCPNCTLDVAEKPYCPAAVRMVGLVAQIDSMGSHDNARVIVVTTERKTAVHTTVERGVCSLMGLLMATSGCPLTTFFKPIARFHLPFANIAETMWRATSMYLMVQYFQSHSNRAPDLKFEGLRAIYNRIQIVNKAFEQRLRLACLHESVISGVIFLDMFAKSMSFAIEQSLEEMRYLFGPYLESAQHTNLHNKKQKESSQH